MSKEHLVDINALTHILLGVWFIGFIIGMIGGLILAKVMSGVDTECNRLMATSGNSPRPKVHPMVKIKGVN